MLFQHIANRDAWATIRGFVYQTDQTIIRWLKLGDDEKLELEKGEDIDVVLHGIEQQEISRILEQIKYRESGLTLASNEIQDAIFNFYQHKNNNPSLNLLFRFVTNAKPTLERPALFEDGKFGIEAWQLLADSSEDNYNPYYLSGIRQKLLSIAKEKCSTISNSELSIKCENWKNYLLSASNQDLLAFIRSIDLSTNNWDAANCNEQIVNLLLSDNFASDESEAQHIYERLFLFVFKTLTKKETKQLDRSRLIELLSSPTLSSQDYKTLRIISFLILNVKEEVERLRLKVSSHDEAILNIQNKLENRAYLKVEYSSDKIKDIFQTASIELQHCPSTFGNLIDSHILRKETTSILEWISEPLKVVNTTGNLLVEYAPPIAVLVGDAGNGKTTIMRDVLIALQQGNIPVLGIKADKLAVTQRADIMTELQLKDDPVDLVKLLISENDKVVVLVDQIDALSQSLSTNRQIITIYNRLIEQLALLGPKVRIIISCRRYDLQYDPMLVQYIEKHIITIGPLNKEEVEIIFQKLGLPKVKITGKLYELLKVPLHLNVFCKVHKNIADFSTLHTIQDLYHELWKQKILLVSSSTPTNPAKVVHLTRLLASKMYENQTIVLSIRLFETEYLYELKYLQTESLIHEEGGKIQFFHQSFFDYVFARSFVEQNQSISLDVLGSEEHRKHQGLFIRSKVRQVLFYLREIDCNGSYVKEINSFICKPNFRFHIKLLVLQVIAFQSDPTIQEERLVKEVIFKEKLLRETFIENIVHYKWFQLIVKAELLQQLIASDYANSHGKIRQLCYRLYSQCPTDILGFLSKLPPFPERNTFIGDVLLSIENVTDPLAKQLFEVVTTELQVNDIWFFHFLEKAASNYPEWVAEKISKRLLKKSVNESKLKLDLPAEHYHFISALDQLYVSAPESSIKITLEILELIIENSKCETTKGQFTSLYDNSSFLFYTPKEDVGSSIHEQLDYKVRRWIIELASKDIARGRSLIDSLLYKNAFWLIGIGLEAIIKLPQDYAGLFYKRLLHNNFITEFNYSFVDYFRYTVCEALKQTFPFFTSIQQQGVLSKILDLRVKTEVMVSNWNGKKERLGSVGRAQYRLLSMLPYEFIYQNPQSKRVFQELQRKFGYQEHKKPEGIEFFGGRVLSDKAYAKMSDIDWINSFIAYDERKEKRWENIDQLSHARRFSEEASKYPERYVQLLIKLVELPQIPQTYVTHGLEGLTKGLQVSESNIIILKYLLFKSSNRDFEPIYHWDLIRVTDWFIKNKTFDEDIFNYLKVFAINGSEKGNESHNLLDEGINQVRGAAIFRLYSFLKEDSYIERIFSILESVAEKASGSTRATAVAQQAYLNKYNRQRSLNVFIKLCEGYEVEIAEAAAQSLKYNIHINFQALIPFFEKAVASDKATKILTQILTIAYVNEYPESERLLEQYLQKGEVAVQGALRIALSFFNFAKTDQQVRCINLLFRFLNVKSENIARTYELAFRDFEVAHFSQLMEFLRAYIESVVGSQRQYSFYMYLLKCVKEYPHECLQLVSKFENHESPDTRYNMLKQHPVEVVLQAYNSFQQYESRTESLELAMDLIDELLRHTVYRLEATKLNELLD